MRNGIDADALVIGAGPAGAATAILLKLAGWRVILVEKSSYPRQKVCGECLSAAGLTLLDQLGVGAAVQDRAGPELREVGWMSGASTLIGRIPPCTESPYRYGRALGRDQLDAILVNRASKLGVSLIQPGKVRSVRGELGGFECEIQLGATRYSRRDGSPGSAKRRVRIVVDAHGSWETGPQTDSRLTPRMPKRGSRPLRLQGKVRWCDDCRKAYCRCFRFRGGYGGLVTAEDRWLTLAGCIRRDILAQWRGHLPGMSAGAAFEQYLRASCRGGEGSTRWRAAARGLAIDRTAAASDSTEQARGVILRGQRRWRDPPSDRRRYKHGAPVRLSVGWIPYRAACLRDR